MLQSALCFFSVGVDAEQCILSPFPYFFFVKTDCCSQENQAERSRGGAGRADGAPQRKESTTEGGQGWLPVIVMSVNWYRTNWISFKQFSYVYHCDFNVSALFLFSSYFSCWTNFKPWTTSSKRRLPKKPTWRRTSISVERNWREPSSWLVVSAVKRLAGTKRLIPSAKSEQFCSLCGLSSLCSSYGTGFTANTLNMSMNSCRNDVDMPLSCEKAEENWQRVLTLFHRFFLIGGWECSYHRDSLSTNAVEGAKFV